MAGLTSDRSTDQLGTPDVSIPNLINFPVEANTFIYAGGLVATNGSGNAVPATNTSSLICWGRAERQVNNLTGAGPGLGTAGAQQVEVHTGVFFFDNSSIAAVTAASVGLACYAENDHTVSLTSQGGTLPFAGTIVALNESGMYPAGVGQVAVLVGIALSAAQQPSEIVKVVIDIPLATIQAKTSGTAFNIGSALPANARLFSTEVNVIATVTGGSISACHSVVQNTAETAGAISASSDVFTATGLQNHVGSNPYASRGGQQLQMTLTAVGDTLANATTGHLAVDLYYAVLP